jgi:hypothetical protein
LPRWPRMRRTLSMPGNTCVQHMRRMRRMRGLQLTRHDVPWRAGCATAFHDAPWRAGWPPAARRGRRQRSACDERGPRVLCPQPRAAPRRPTVWAWPLRTSALRRAGPLHARPTARGASPQRRQSDGAVASRAAAAAPRSRRVGGRVAPRRVAAEAAPLGGGVGGVCGAGLARWPAAPRYAAFGPWAAAPPQVVQAFPGACSFLFRP